MPVNAVADDELESLSWVGWHQSIDLMPEKEVLDLLVATGKLLAALAQPAGAHAAMRSLLVEVANPASEQARLGLTQDIDRLGWHTFLLEDFPGGQLDWPTRCADFEWLFAYAIDGVVFEGCDLQPIDERRSQLEARFSRVQHLLEVAPAQWLRSAEISGPRDWSLAGIHAAALARWKLDTAQELALTEIATLGRVDLKTVQNAVSDGRLPMAASGVPAAAGLAWLETRRPRRFRASRWLNPNDDQNSIAPDHDPERSRDDVVLVPVDTRGDAFLPGLARPARNGGQLGFQIGPKGAEERISNYFAALDRLKRMHPPRWRRPNSEGNWGIVSGVPLWRSIPRKQIDEQLRRAGFATEMGAE